MSTELILQSLTRKKQYKYPSLLLCLYITLLLITVCLANRLTTVGNLLEPGGIFTFPLTFTICDIVGEVYGYAYPRLFIWLGLLAEVIFSVSVTLISHLPPAAALTQAHAYHIVFDPTLRYVGSGMVALLIGEFANIYLLSKWKIALHGRFFILRSLLSTAFGQACLTVIVDILNYTGKLSTAHLEWMMLCGYVWKMVYAFVLVLPAWSIIQYLKKIEHVDYYDIHTNFNPFLLTIEHENTH